MKNSILTFILIILITVPSFAQKNVKLMNAGVFEMQKENYQEALVLLDKSIAKNPNFYLAYYNKAVCYNQLLDDANFKLNIDKCLALNPNDYSSLILLTAHYYRKGDLKTAQTWAEKAILSNPEGFEANLFMGDFAAENHDIVAAEQHYKKAYDKIDDKCKIATYYAITKMLNGDKDGASNLFNQCKTSEFYTEDDKVREVLFLYHTNQDALAEQRFKTVNLSKIKSQNLLQYYFFIEGVNQMEQQHYLKAVTMFHRAQQNQDDDPYIYYNRAICYQHLEDYDNAMSDIDNFLKIHGDQDSAFKIKSSILEDMGKKKDAILYLQKAANVRQQNDTFYRRLAMLYYFEEDINSAAKYIDTALAINPHSGLLYLLKLQINQKGISDKLFYQLVDSATKYELENKDIFNLKFDILTSNNKSKQAKELLEVAFKKGLDSSYYYAKKALFLMEEEGHEKEAMALVEKAIAIDSNATEPYLIKSFILEDKGDLKGKAKMLEAVLTKDIEKNDKMELYGELIETYEEIEDFDKVCQTIKNAINDGFDIPKAIYKEYNCTF